MLACSALPALMRAASTISRTSASERTRIDAPTGLEALRVVWRSTGRPDGVNHKVGNLSWPG
jgi:hypothetical protein